MAIGHEIKQKALKLGFDLAGIADSKTIPKKDIDILKSYLRNENAAQMSYMHRNLEKRISPQTLFPPAKSVICVALNYKPIGKSNLPYNSDPVCEIADFARYQDYHGFIKSRLVDLAGFIKENINSDLEYKICVDSTPLAERSLAARAGLGFIGKNKMLINPKIGLNLLLGELIVNLELEPDQPMQNLCTGCDKCLSSCPGGAFLSGNFDSNKCISYVTTEHKDSFSDIQKKLMGTSLFGCDRCIKACPFYSNAQVRKNTDFKYIDPLSEVSLCDLLYWTEKEFDKNLKGTTMHRLGLENLKRNALACLENHTSYGTKNTSESFSGLSRPE